MQIRQPNLEGTGEILLAGDEVSAALPGTLLLGLPADAVTRIRTLSSPPWPTSTESPDDGDDGNNSRIYTISISPT
jgi:hypothetical protein